VAGERSKRQGRATRAVSRRSGKLLRRRLVAPLTLSSLVLLMFGVGGALADESQSAIPAPNSEAANEGIAQAMWAEIEAGNPQRSQEAIAAAETDAEAAEELPHRELDRGEALELMQRVFGAELQNSAGIFDELEVERFLSNYAAIVPAGRRLAASGVLLGEAPSAEDHATLLESTVPLRAPNDLGAEQPVDLGLESIEGELQPANPLVEVSLPQELGEGIELPGAGVQIELVGAPQERAPSTLEQSVAAYPNVAQDTAFAVAPTPTGVETMTLLQSADAPRSETFRLDLPQDASLESTEDGGAEVRSGGELLLAVEPPSAIDAKGMGVPTSLQVEGNKLVLRISPGPETSFPVLLDPVYDTFNWNGVTTTTNSWVTSSFNNNGALGGARDATCSNTFGAANECGSPLKEGTPGLYAYAQSGQLVPANSWLQEAYFVPRAGSDYGTYGTLPSSFIESMTINHLGFWHRGDSSASPYLGAGIWAGPEPPGPTANPAGWTSFLSRGGNQEDLPETLQYTFGGGGNHNAKEALVGMMAPTGHTMTSYRDSLFREVTISLGDVDKPGFGSITPPSSWMDQTAAPVGFTVSDSGLGVSNLTMADRQSPQHFWTTSYGCVGTNDNACPHTWKSTESGHPALSYDPKVLPTGIDTLDVTATDPVGNLSSSSAVPVKVDHTAPSLSLSGTMTEQGILGTTRPRYVLKASAIDGTEASPQSGVASVKVSVDGKQVQFSQPGCSTKNCNLSTEWTLNSSAYSAGYHFVTVTASDAVGRSSTKELLIQIQRDTSKPTISLSGELQEAPDSWVNQRNYTFAVGGSDGGYGVTRLEVLIDGKAASGGTAEQSCAEGGCSFNKTFTLNMANYSGGEHTGTVVVTDGAGNKADISSPFRVDPSGTVTASEAAQTIEAAEETSGLSILESATSKAEAGEEGRELPGLKVVEGTLESTGAPVTSTVAESGATTIASPDGAVELNPMNQETISTPMELTSGATGAASGNIAEGSDSAVRPIFDGVLSFAAIRGAEAPEEYSWTVELAGGETLEQITSTAAEVYYEDGTPAMAIATEGAHDATGVEVPTSLKVSGGNVITLTVAHRPREGRSNYVYPVIGGAGFQTAYETVEAIPAPIAKEEEELARLEREEQEIREMIERTEEENARLEEEIAMIEREIAEFEQWGSTHLPVGYNHLGAPIPLPDGSTDDEGAEASSAGGHAYVREYEYDLCMYDGPGGCFNYDLELVGKFEYNGHYAWWKPDKPHPRCPYSAHTATVNLDFCNWVGNNHQRYGGGYHISSQAIYHVDPAGVPVAIEEPITEYMYGDGYANGHNTTCICNPLPK
jgi:hypothetical protein